MSTRHAEPGAESPAHANMSNPKVAGINVGLNIVVKIAGAHGERMRRAMIWLANYANVRGCTADALAAELSLGKGEIRSALSDPEFEDFDRFVAAVEQLRRAFEATIKDYHPTALRRLVDQAMSYALKKRKMIEIVAKTRMGKSDCARVWWLRNLDRVIWFECPTNADERSFLFTLARACGIGVTTAKKPAMYWAQIRSLFHDLGIHVLVVDESHRLWPADSNRIPKRVENLREFFADGRGCSVVTIGTPQHTESLTASLETNGRWAPGQYEGRVVRFHADDAMSLDDLRGVARWHAPDAGRDVVEALVEWGTTSAGYAGAMVNVIDLAREVYLPEGAPLTLEAVTDAMLQQARGSRIGKLVAAPGIKTPRRKAA